MANILVIDDHETIRLGIQQIVQKMGHTVSIAASGAEGLSLFVKQEFDFVMTDLKMEGIDGVQVLQAIREKNPDVPTMIITAHGTVETAVEAMKIGAFDFIQKPFPPEVVRLKVERALELRQIKKVQHLLQTENDWFKEELQFKYSDLVGGSDKMKAIFKLLDRVSPTDSFVCILGESGTGKELVARAIHERSKRAEGPFIKVNCGALSETLLESELFGHEKGAFTGALKRKLGRFELARGGTIFLDEIGDVSSSLQLKLLRVLQEREFERVGGEVTLKVDVRVISATNKNLNDAVEKGTFREDLFYRLHVVPIHMPPLRERRDDIPLLIQHFIKKMAPRINPNVQGISDDALMLLMAYDWKGNVRELENTVEQALVFTDEKQISVTALPGVFHPKPSFLEERLEISDGEKSLPEMLDELEKGLILKAYQKSGGVKTETARLLGVKTSALYYKLEKYGIGEGHETTSEK